MPRAVRFSLIALLLLLPGLAIKEWSTFAQVGTDFAGMSRTIARQFAAREWSAQAVDDNLFPYARLERGDCRMVAAAMVPNGALARRFAMQMRTYGPVTYFYRDRFLERPPRARPVLTDYFQRKLRSLGIDWKMAPVLGIAAGPGCRLQKGDWQALRIGTTVSG